MNAQYVQYGCGLSCPEGWENFDSSPTLRLQRIPIVGRFIRRRGLEPFPRRVRVGDITRGLPIKSGSCKGVYCSHVLEHLAVQDFRKALRNTYDLLASDGTFRFVLPDLERYARDYLDSDSDTASLTFMSDAHLGNNERRRGMNAILHALFSGSSHLSMWDEKSLTRELAETGFTEIRRARTGDSRDDRFTGLEAENRWDRHLGMECIKT